MFELALSLARIQFGFTISWHVIFLALSIGLSTYLVILESRWLSSNDHLYLTLYRFWAKIFALCFSLAVVSGLVIIYQFGLNWSGLSTYAGGILGPLLTYTILCVFFLESGFLGVMLFGWNKVSPKVHFISTCVVALGGILSLAWFTAASSWMHTPQGIAVVDGMLVPLDWMAIIFNPSFPYRGLHMLTASYLATALVIAAAGAWQLIRDRQHPGARKMLSMSMWFVLVLAPLQGAIGHLHGLNTMEHQPAKIAAMQGNWENKPGQATSFKVIAFPDMEKETNYLAVEIPYLDSLILRHSLTEPVPALKDFAREDRPNAAVVFWSFRIMVALGTLMVLLGLYAAWARWHGRLFSNSLLLRTTLWMGPAGILAILSGWYTTEMGRQPWLINGMLRTTEAAGPHGSTEVGFTLALFLYIYLAVFFAGITYILRWIKTGPEPANGASIKQQGITADRPGRFMIAPEFHSDNYAEANNKE